MSADESIIKQSLYLNVLVRHAGLEEPAPYLIRGHSAGFKKTGFQLSLE